jgi:L-threonylcarbamoyladenylate synthase
MPPPLSPRTRHCNSNSPRKVNQLGNVNFWQLKQAARSLNAGGLIAYPTEAVYGLGCDPLNAQAVMRLLSLKQRDVAKGLILIAADITQLAPYIDVPSVDIQAKLDASWPGPVTWLLTPRPHVPQWLTGAHDRIAVRVTAHPVASALCQAFGGAIVSTSANPSNLSPARNPLTVRRYFDGHINIIVHGSLGSHGKPTIIRDALTDRILRPG